MVFEHLATGRDNAVKAKDLAEQLGCSTREITKAVQTERRQGYPICVSHDGKSGGYYLASTTQELESTCNRLRHRAGEIYATRKHLLETLDKMKKTDS